MTDRVVHLGHCVVVWTREGCRTVFKDGTHVDAVPHPHIPHYSVIAHRCGYEDDLLAYCREHEVAHCLIAEWFQLKASDVLWNLAHSRHAAPYHVVAEEALAQMLQRFVRANERPIISGVDWNGLRARMLDVLSEGESHDEAQAQEGREVQVRAW